MERTKGKQENNLYIKYRMRCTGFGPNCSLSPVGLSACCRARVLRMKGVYMHIFAGRWASYES